MEKENDGESRDGDEVFRLKPDNDLTWTIVMAIVAAEQKGLKIPAVPEQGVKISFKINDVQVPFATVCKYIHQKYNDELMRKAAELKRDKVDGMVEAAHKIAHNLEKANKRICGMINKEFGIPTDEFEE